MKSMRSVPVGCGCRESGTDGGKSTEGQVVYLEGGNGGGREGWRQVGGRTGEEKWRGAEHASLAGCPAVPGPCTCLPAPHPHSLCHLLRKAGFLPHFCASSVSALCVWGCAERCQCQQLEKGLWETGPQGWVPQPGETGGGGEFP